jgi:limonene-1,2-epoxide hydrolase
VLPAPTPTLFWSLRGFPQARDRAEAKAAQQADELSKIGSHLAVIREVSDSQHGMLTERLQVGGLREGGRMEDFERG